MFKVDTKTKELPVHTLPSEVDAKYALESIEFYFHKDSIYARLKMPHSDYYNCYTVQHNRLQYVGSTEDNRFEEIVWIADEVKEWFSTGYN